LKLKLESCIKLLFDIRSIQIKTIEHSTILSRKDKEINEFYFN